ncbi:PAS domain-containing sensor histidine kinase [Methyloversatilis sp.]|uniref:PAS domain-containing sensor histidine kinase n=1 Tax=Methyloversatilis sp. TaxID=2569862 RepID=UPI003F6FDE5D
MAMHDDPAATPGAASEAGLPPAELLGDALARTIQGVWLAAPDGSVRWCNARAAELAGAPATATPATQLADALCRGSGDAPALAAAVGAALAAGRAFHAEVEGRAPDGAPCWRECWLDPVHDAAGRCTHWVGIVDDVSPRRRAEAALRAVEQRRDFLLDHIQAGIVVHRADTEILYANETAAWLLGVGRHEIRGAVNTDPRWGFIRADGSRMPIPEYPVNRAVATRAVVRQLVLGIYRSSDRQLVWLMCNAYPVLGTDGVPTEVVVSFTDVTRLKEAERELHESEERLQLVLRGSNDAPWDQNLVDGAAYYAPRWLQMLGHEPGDLPADADLWHRLTHPDDRACVAAAYAAVLADPAQESFKLEYRLLHRDGHAVPVLSRGFVLRDADGRALRVAGVNTDLTERRRAEAALRAQQAAEQASAAKTAFLSRMSHELRTPLNAVLGFAQLMRMDDAAPLVPAQAARLRQIEDAGQHLLGMIQDLLDVARIEHAQPVVAVEDLLLAPVVDEALALVSTAAAERGVQVHL